MAKWMKTISTPIQEFIAKQQMFFVATAGTNDKVNVSPKGLESLKVLNENRVIWLNLGGSGNETERQVLETNRMTLMFCAFEGNPLILRLYGSAKIIRSEDENWNELLSLFPDSPRARQIFDMSVEDVQSSCGYGVPFYQYEAQREKLTVPKIKKT